VPGVLLYFDRISTIRRCPYTDVAFVGIPYEAACAGDWHAISHEIGHYVYWNFIPPTPLAHIKGAPNGAPEHPIKAAARAFLDANPGAVTPKKRALVRDLLLAWLEETFADVFGARLDGEASIASLERRIVREAGNADDLSATDGRHPPPYLRLSIRELAVQGARGAKTLKVRGNGRSTARTSLFFEQRFNITESSAPRIKAYRELSVPTDRTQLATLRKQAEPIPLPAADLQAGLKVLIPMLTQQIELLLSEGHAQRRVGGVSAFERLRAQADQVDGDVDDVLLNPRILEGAHDSSGGHGGQVAVIGGPHTWTMHDDWPHDH
jgi:hypothetical protein